MRYCLYANREWISQSYGITPKNQDYINYDELPFIMHSGLTNWPRVFKGVMATPEVHQLENYDVVHINATPSNIMAIKKMRNYCNLLRDAGRQAPIIVTNPDHAVDMWHKWERIDLWLEALRMADVVFGTEPVMANALKSLLDKDVPCIPHPTAVDIIRANFRKTDYSNSNGKMITVVSHTYDQNLRLLLPMLSRLKKNDPEIILTLIGPATHPTETGYVFDLWYPSLPFSEFFNMLKESSVVIDTAITYSYGRVGVECTAIGVPVIGAVNVASINKLSEFVVEDIHNIYSIEYCLNDILYNLTESTIRDVMDGSFDVVDYYSYDKLRHRLMSLIKTAKVKYGKEIE